MRISRAMKGFAAAAALAVAGSASAGVVTVTFDSAPIGVQTNVDGVVFSGGAVGGINVGAYALTPAAYPLAPASFLNAGNKGIFVNPTASGQETIATFGQLVSNVSLDFVDTEIGSVLGRLRAFDALNNVLFDTLDVITINNNAPNPLGIGTLSANVSGIHHIAFSTDGDGAVVDNLRFTVPDNPVPEPASLALLGLGLAGMMASRRRKTR